MKLSKLLSLTSLAASATVMLPTAAFARAQDAGDMANGLWSQMSDIGRMIVALLFVAGIVFVGGGLMKLKTAVETQGQRAQMSHAAIGLIVGFALTGITGLILIGSETFGFGDPGVNVTAGGGQSF